MLLPTLLQVEQTPFSSARSTNRIVAYCFFAALWVFVDQQPNVTPPSWTTQYHSYLTDYTNTPNTYLSLIQFGSYDTGVRRYKTVDIEHGTATAVRFKAINTTSPFTVDSVTFDKEQVVAIHLDRTGATGLTEYDDAVIQNCTFKELTVKSGGAPNQILVTNYVPTVATGGTTPMEHLEVQGNLFQTADEQGTGSIAAAIRLRNSSGAIVGNRITVAKYANGIYNEPINLASDPTSNSLICSNYITSPDSLTGIGIRTKNWNGYAKLNEVNHRNIGHQSEANDRGFVIFSRYNDNSGLGLKLIDASSLISMAGVHSPTSDGPDDYAAYDTVDNNNAGHSTGQIEMAASSELWLGKQFSWWTNYANNNIRIGLTGSTKLIVGDGSPSSTSTVGPVDTTYWGGYTPQATNPTSGVFDTKFPNVTYTRAAPPAISEIGFSGWVSCGDGVDEITTRSSGKKNDRTMSVLDNSDPYTDSACHEWYGMAIGYNQEGKYQAAYDTARHFIEHCANTPNSRQGFKETGIAVQYISNDNNRWLEYREWLKSVLYLNTDTLYYCSDILAMGKTFQYIDPKTGMRDYRGERTLDQFVIENGKCPMFTDDFKEDYVSAYQVQRQRYFDTLKVTTDTNLYPFDSTIPTIDELGLGILRQNPNSSVRAIDAPKFSIGSLSASSNPFTQETEITLEMNATSVVRFDLLNELGQTVQSNNVGGLGRVTERGKHQIPLNGSDLASGTYYARFSTPYGEVKTLKLRHLK